MGGTGKWGGTLGGGTLWGGPGIGPAVGQYYVHDVIYRALRQIHCLPRAQTMPNSSQYQDGLLWLNQTVDEWSARKPFAWATTFNAYTLTPGYPQLEINGNIRPIYIGPGLTAPDFGATRPEKIESASIILNNLGPFPTDVPMNIRDSAWWAAQRVKTIVTSVPTDLYYEPEVPNGALYIWPIPSEAYQIRLETWVVLTQFASIQSQFIAPPAYLHAMMYTLAEQLCTPMGVPVPPELPMLGVRARKAVQLNNMESPRSATADWGTAGRPRGDFNWATGTIPN